MHVFLRVRDTATSRFKFDLCLLQYIASSFLLTVAMLEMLSNLAVERLLVQDQDGNDPDFQAMAQLIVAVRGLINGAIIFALAWPVASFSWAEMTANVFRQRSTG